MGIIPPNKQQTVMSVENVGKGIHFVLLKMTTQLPYNYINRKKGKIYVL